MALLSIQSGPGRFSAVALLIMSCRPPAFPRPRLAISTRHGLRGALTLQQLRGRMIAAKTHERRGGAESLHTVLSACAN